MITEVGVVIFSNRVSKARIQLNHFFIFPRLLGCRYRFVMHDISLHHLTVIDKMSNPTDPIFFDGVSNNQKSGENIEPKFYRVTCIHGAE